MKIRLNEKDKSNIENIAEYAVAGIDLFITGVGCGVTGAIACGINKKAMCLGAVLAAAIYTFRIKGDYYDTLLCDTDNACDWIFNKLEKSNQKVIEFEK